MEEGEKDVEKAADEDDVAAVRSTLIMRTWRILTRRFQILLLFLFIYLFFTITRCYIHYNILQEQKKEEQQFT